MFHCSRAYKLVKNSKCPSSQKQMLEVQSGKKCTLVPRLKEHEIKLLGATKNFFLAKNKMAVSCHHIK